MPKEMYKPVALNVDDAIAKAKERPGFNKDWDALEVEYAALYALLSPRAVRVQGANSALLHCPQP
jgi:hypothetical protein